MANRIPGVFNFSSNFETLIAAPLDARLTVPVKAALTDGVTIPYPYKGMIVSVTDDTFENNGIYHCTDVGTGGNFATADAVWVKVVSGIDTHVTGATVNSVSEIISLHFNNGKPDVDINLTGITSDFIVSVDDELSGIVSGETCDLQIVFNLNDDTQLPVIIDLTGIENCIGGTVVSNELNGTDLVLTLNDGTQIVTSLDSIYKYVTGGTTSAGTGGTTDIKQDLTYNDGDSFEVDLAPAFTFTNNNPTKVTVGGVEEGVTIFDSGKTLHEIIQAMFYPKIEPTITYGSYSITANGGTLIEVGNVFDLTINGNYQKGQSIVSGQPTKYMGDAESYEFLMSGVFDVTGITSGSTYTVNSFTMPVGAKTIQSKVNYGVGQQPVYDDGSDYIDTDFTDAGYKTAIKNVEGVYPIFATSVNVTTATKQPLKSMLSSFVEIDLAAETGTTKHFFEIATGWTGGQPTEIYYFNTVSNQYDTLNKIGEFDVTTVQETVQGNLIDYYKYTHNGILAGERKIKVVF